MSEIIEAKEGTPDHLPNGFAAWAAQHWAGKGGSIVPANADKPPGISSRRASDEPGGGSGIEIDPGELGRQIVEGIHLQPGDKGYVPAADPADVDAAMHRLQAERKNADPKVDVKLVDRLERDIFTGNVDDIQAILKEYDGKPVAFKAADQQAAKELSHAGIVMAWAGGTLHIMHERGTQDLQISKDRTAVMPGWISGANVMWIEMWSSEDRANLLREIGRYGVGRLKRVA